LSHADTSFDEKIAVVLDTGALLAKYYRFIPRQVAEAYTTASASGEVRDRENRDALEEAVDLGLIRVVTPGQGFIEVAKNAARAVGCLHKLSLTDVEIVALALSLKSSYRDVVVVTDDYELQNLLAHLGISYRPLRTRGIREVKAYVAQCPLCGYVPGKPGEEVCPFCGIKIRRREVTC